MVVIHFMCIATLSLTSIYIIKKDNIYMGSFVLMPSMTHNGSLHSTVSKNACHIIYLKQYAGTIDDQFNDL